LGAEEEGGAVDLLSSSERQGKARNGGLRRQPWRSSSSTGSVFTGEREEEGAREREEGKDVSWRRWASPGELLGGLGGKQEVALGNVQEQGT
jgi:hypothetical protein